MVKIWKKNNDENSKNKWWWKFEKNNGKRVTSANFVAINLISIIKNRSLILKKKWIFLYFFSNIKQKVNLCVKFFQDTKCFAVNHFVYVCVKLGLKLGLKLSLVWNALSLIWVLVMTKKYCKFILKIAAGEWIRSQWLKLSFAKPLFTTPLIICCPTIEQ